mgnify:CR=1 FL=1
MNMKGKLGMYMAMAMAMGGMGMEMPAQRTKYKPQPRPLTPEEEVIELEKRQAKFLLDLVKHNDERSKNFPKWQMYDVHSLLIVASNQKNAIRDMNFLMRLNLIEMRE